MQSGELKVIEFFGIPGVGKSYLVKNAFPGNCYRPLELYSQRSKLLRVLRKIWLLFRHVPTSIVCLSWAKDLVKLYPSINRYRRWKVLFNWIFIDSVLRDAVQARHGLVVLDQGIVQGLWSTHLGAGTECQVREVQALMRRYLETLPVTEWAVVHVAAPQGTVRVRVEEREGFSPLDQDLSRMDEALSAERVAKEVVVSLSRCKPPPKIKIVDFFNDGEKSVTRLQKLIGLKQAFNET